MGAQHILGLTVLLFADGHSLSEMSFRLRNIILLLNIVELHQLRTIMNQKQFLITVER
jgi:hypothetical protein